MELGEMLIEVTLQAKKLQMEGLIFGNKEFPFVPDHGEKGVRELPCGVDDPAIGHQHRLYNVIKPADPDDRVNAQGDDQNKDGNVADDQSG
jgi:hypothetical protein